MIGEFNSFERYDNARNDSTDFNTRRERRELS